MTEAQIRRFKAYKGALGYVRDRRDILGPEVAAVARQLADVCDEIEHCKLEQLNPHASAGRVRRHADQLRNAHLIAVARMVRRFFRDDPAVLAQFRVPHKRAPIEEIEEAARRMIAGLERYYDFLTAQGIDPQRIERVTAELQALADARQFADEYVPRRSAATHTMKSLFRRASDDLRALDALIRASQSGESLGAWVTTSRVGKRIGRPKRRRRATRVGVSETVSG